MKRVLDGLFNRPVVVRAGGVDYRGRLREVSEEEVALQGPTGWCAIPMERVQEIRADERGEKI